MDVRNVGYMPQMPQTNAESEMISRFMQGLFDVSKLALQFEGQNQDRARQEKIDNQNGLFQQMRLDDYQAQKDKDAQIRNIVGEYDFDNNSKEGLFRSLSAVDPSYLDNAFSAPVEKKYQPFGYGQQVDQFGNVVNVPVEPQKPDKPNYGFVTLPTSDGNGEQVFRTVNGQPTQAVGGVKPYSTNTQGQITEKDLVKKMQDNQTAYRNIRLKQASDAYGSPQAYEEQLKGLSNQNLQLAQMLKNMYPNSPFLQNSSGQKPQQPQTNRPPLTSFFK